MKFGADNSKKTIAAAALFLVGLVMFIRMISGSSSSPAPATAAAPAPAAPQPRVTARRSSGGNQHGRSKNDKNAGPVTPSLDPRLHLAELKEAEETTYDGTGRNIFVAGEEPKIETQVASAILPGKNQTEQPPPPPPGPQVRQPPPINLKFFGFASGPDHKRVFLAHGDDVMVAAEGDIVERRYKIVKINNNNIEVLDVLSNNHQTIPLTAG